MTIAATNSCHNEQLAYGQLVTIVHDDSGERSKPTENMVRRVI